MSIESPENKKEISDAEWEQIKQEAQYWTDRIMEHKNVSRSYGHILYNLRSYFHRDALDEASPEERPSTYRDAVEGFNYVKRYFKLLEDFPEFAEKELKPGEGYFPELMNVLGRSYLFVDEYETRLRGTRNSGEKEKVD